MIKNLRRRGQAVIEFAMILPIFAVLLFASIYIGFFVLDYVTMDAAAAYAARDAATRGSTTVNDGVRNKIHGTKLYLDRFYEVDSQSPIVKTETVTDGTFYTAMIKLKKKETHTILDWILPGENVGVTVKKSAYKVTQSGAGG